MCMPSMPNIIHIGSQTKISLCLSCDKCPSYGMISCVGKKKIVLFAIGSDLMRFLADCGLSASLSRLLTWCCAACTH
jgi:hypothetical protein